MDTIFCIIIRILLIITIASSIALNLYIIREIIRVKRKEEEEKRRWR